MNVRPLLAVSLALGLAAACGNSNPAPQPPTGGTATTASESAAPAPSESAAASATPSAAPSAVTSAEAPKKSWDAMSHDERLALMKTVVMPKMKEAFQKFDAKKFADFSCKTCHGGPENKGAMPNKDVPKLDMKDMLAKHKKKTPEELDFMIKVVSPEMANILGLPHYDPKTKTGFGCGGCHFFEK